MERVYPKPLFGKEENKKEEKRREKSREEENTLGKKNAAHDSGINLRWGWDYLALILSC